MTENVLPRPSSLSIVASPPCRRASSRTSESPIPVPSKVRARASRTRWKRSNRRGSSSAGMPMPVSVTVSSAPSRVAVQGDRDASVERVLERVREQVEDDLLPHLVVDEERLGQRLAVDDELEAGLLDRRPEEAREVGGVGRQVGRHVARVHAPGLDAREVQQRIHEPQQPHAVAVRGRQALAACRRKLAVGGRKLLLQRAEHQRQRCAELVRDVGEEGRLGAVDVGQRLGAGALLLVGERVGQGAGHALRDEVEEAAVGLVQRQPGADAGDEDARRPLGARRADRQEQGLLERLLVRAGVRAESLTCRVSPLRTTSATTVSARAGARPPSGRPAAPPSSSMR